MKHLCLAIALTLSASIASASPDCDGPLSAAAIDAHAQELVDAVHVGWECRDKGTSVQDCITQFANEIGGG